MKEQESASARRMETHANGKPGTDEKTPDSLRNPAFAKMAERTRDVSNRNAQYFSGIPVGAPCVTVNGYATNALNFSASSITTRGKGSARRF